jgi:hypothetical protein
MRPVENNYIESMELAQSYGVPVWVDFDDILHEVPEDNPSYKYFSQKHILENLEFALKNANIVTFSTKELKKYYDYIREDSIVIENAFNDYNYVLKDEYNDSKIISWRGSDTHRKDLMSQFGSITSINSRFDDWQWFFLGCSPYYITEFLKNYQVQDQVEIIRYNRLMINLCPAIHIVPLVHSVFNRAKSNIAWIEATSAGAVCLVPRLPEFEKPGMVNYSEVNPSNFEYVFEKMIKSKSFREENFKKSRDYIKNNLLLSQVNIKRLEIVKELVK